MTKYEIYLVSDNGLTVLEVIQAEELTVFDRYYKFIRVEKNNIEFESIRYPIDKVCIKEMP